MDGDQTPISGKTNGDGEVRSSIRRDTATVTIVFPDRQYGRTFSIGTFDPAETMTGAQARLRQLAYYQGEVDGVSSPLTTAAIESFQKDQELTTSGVMDTDTVAALQRAYGS